MLRFAHPSLCCVLLILSVLIMCIFSVAKNTQNTEHLDENELLKCISEKTPPIDIILIPPFVIDPDTKTNFSAMSILRFAPWVHRIHIKDQNQQQSQQHFDYWQKNQDKRLIFFHEDLLTYSVQTPYLAEHFIVLFPQYLITNYVFPWQFVVRDQLSRKSCKSGLACMTRTLLNECYPMRTEVLDEVFKCLKNNTDDYLNNYDHFIPACSNRRISSTKLIRTFESNTIKSYFQFEDIEKTPSAIHLIVVDQIEDDLVFALERTSVMQLWVHIANGSASPAKRLSFLHRMRACKNLSMECQRQNPEKMGADIMKQVRKLGVKIARIYSNSACQKLGNKLSVVYQCPSTVLILKQEASDELDRLSAL